MYRPGSLSTLTLDDYPGLPGVFVQVWNGSHDEAKVFFRAYGESPAQANDLAWLASHALNIRAETGKTPVELAASLADAQAEIARLRGALEEVVGCFHAADIENLQALTAETQDEQLKDLLTRRLAYARYAAEDALK